MNLMHNNRRGIAEVLPELEGIDASVTYAEPSEDNSI